MPLVDIVFAVMKTATMDRPMATSYEIIWALDRRPPSSGYVEPEAVPVGPGAVLHPGHDPSLVPDREQCHDHEEREDRNDLDEHQPDRIVAELVEVHRVLPAV